DRMDFNPKQFANIDLFLTWDWVTVSVGKGDYRDAFKRILQTRRKGKDLLRPINRVRLQWLIALIALGCAEQDPAPRHTFKTEQNPAARYTYDRLLVVAEKAIDDAYSALKECKDERGRALTLLAEAKLLGMLGIKEGRLDKINDAEAIAIALDDPILHGYVDIARGDESVFQRKRGEAKVFYRKVEREMTQRGYLDLANMARQRIVRLNAPTRRKSPQKHSGSSGSPPNAPNEPPPDDKLPLN
ncbi:MAG TPA: hypothetical protein VFW76_12070, partial [Ktedonobacterales bacterium]|nr:hypothetical protein [Ktedonobacterales bacterium]